MITILARLIVDMLMGIDDHGHASGAEVAEDNTLMIMCDVQFYQVVNVQ
jgi:hypothetical protein